MSAPCLFDPRLVTIRCSPRLVLMVRLVAYIEMARLLGLSFGAVLNWSPGLAVPMRKLQCRCLAWLVLRGLAHLMLIVFWVLEELLLGWTVIVPVRMQLTFPCPQTGVSGNMMLPPFTMFMLI